MVSREAVAALLHELYIGEPRARLRADDERKVDEVTALLDELDRVLPRVRPATVVDLGAGRSLVGFAAVLLLAPDRPVSYLGVERDAARAARAEALAAGRGRGRLAVVAGDAAVVPLPVRPDVVLALHACGEATDDAIARAISLEARHALIVPCCRRRRERASFDRLGIPTHAGVRTPLDELLTDAERVLELEAAGYEVTVLPLVPASTTPQNRLLRARRIAEPRRATGAARGLARLRATFG